MQNPGVYRLFCKHFVNTEFNSVEAYNAEVLKFFNTLRTEIEQIEKEYLTKRKSVMRVLNVKIKGENDES